MTGVQTCALRSISSFLNLLSLSYKKDERLDIVFASNSLAYGRTYTAQTVRDWVLDFLKRGGVCQGVSFKRRTPYSLINDEDVRLELTKWLLVATRAVPSCFAKDFAFYLLTKYGVKLKLGMAIRWIKALGFSFRSATSLELYRDGHERKDVVAARNQFITTVFTEIYPFIVSWGGENMDIPFKGQGLLTGTSKQIEICVHDECCFECHDTIKSCWIKPGHGTPKQKNRGAGRMISAYACSLIGIFNESLESVDVGGGTWWTGEKFIQQVPIFLAEFDKKLPNITCCAIYDNSSNHGCDPKDALRVEKDGFNKFAGGKNRPIMRDGFFMNGATKVNQSMFFKKGDTILFPTGNIKANKKTELGKGSSTLKYYPEGFVITEETHELVGVVKGVVQIIKERGLNFEMKGNIPASCLKANYITNNAKKKKKALKEYEVAKQLGSTQNPRYKTAALALLELPDSVKVAYEASIIICNCANCVLNNQEDFLEQKSGIEEAYSHYNLSNGTNHKCIFLPKFHPELNFIERIWGRMKYYLRLHCDNSFKTMVKNIEKATEQENLPIAMIRRYARTTFAYLYAYRNGLDIVNAHEWVKKHRAHRGHSDLMDSVLENSAFDKDLKDLYYPNNDYQVEFELENVEHLEEEVIFDESIVTNIQATNETEDDDLQILYSDDDE